jgi:hypothetical protein
MQTKGGQAWGFDLMIALVIFIAGLVTFFLYALNTPETEITLNKLIYEGNIIADTLLSQGSPTNWNEQNVITPGILTSNKINNTQLEKFYNLSLTNYPQTKRLFNTRYEYYIFLSNKNFTIEGNSIQGIGSQPVNPANLIKISRATIYNNRPITFNVDVWES